MGRRDVSQLGPHAAERQHLTALAETRVDTHNSRMDLQLESSSAAPTFGLLDLLSAFGGHFDIADAAVAKRFAKVTASFTIAGCGPAQADVGLWFGWQTVTQNNRQRRLLLRERAHRSRAGLQTTNKALCVVQ